MNTARICAIILAVPGTILTTGWLVFAVSTGFDVAFLAGFLAALLLDLVPYCFWIIRALNIWIMTWRPVAWAIVSLAFIIRIILLAASTNPRWGDGSIAIHAVWLLFACTLSLTGLISDLRVDTPQTHDPEPDHSSTGNEEYKRLLHEHRSRPSENETSPQDSLP